MLSKKITDPKKSKKQRVKAKAPVALVGMDLDSIPDYDNLKLLRAYGKVYYSTSINRCTVQEMSKHPLFAAVHPSTMQRWAATDGWVGERDLFWRQMGGEVAKRVASEMARARAAELHQLNKIAETMITRLLDEDGEQKWGTFEQTVNALVKLIDTIDGYRERLLAAMPQVVAESSGEQKTTLSVQARMDQESIRKLARAATQLARERRAKGSGS